MILWWGLNSSAPQGGQHQTGQDPGKEQADQTESGTVQPSQESLETELLLTILVVNLWVCILLVFRTRDRIFHLREQRVEKHMSEVQE